MPPQAPIYNLSELHDLAEDPDRIVFHGREAHKSSLGLGYSLDDIARCIKSLAPTDFHKRLVYETGDPPTRFDVYKSTFELNEQHTDYLYIKLALNDCGQIVVASFKLV